ncbi:MAG: hypothetical protein ABIQ44_07490 [Chloroflexia bacterium]
MSGLLLLLAAFFLSLLLVVLVQQPSANAAYTSRQGPMATSTPVTPTTCFYTPLTFNLSGQGNIEATRPFTVVAGDNLIQFGPAAPITATALSSGAALLNSTFSGAATGDISGAFILTNVNGLAITGSTASPNVRGILVNNLQISSAQGSMNLLFAANLVGTTSVSPFYPRTFTGYVHSMSTTGAYAGYSFEGTITGTMGQPIGNNVPLSAVIEGKLFNGFDPPSGILVTNGSRVLPLARSLTYMPTDTLAQFTRADLPPDTTEGNFYPISVFSGISYGSINGTFTLDNNPLLSGHLLDFSLQWIAGNMRITNNANETMSGIWVADTTAPSYNGYFFQTAGTGIFASSHIFGLHRATIGYQGGRDLAGNFYASYCGSMLPVAGTATPSPTFIATAIPTATPTATQSPTNTATPPIQPTSTRTSTPISPTITPTLASPLPQQHHRSQAQPSSPLPPLHQP